MRRRQRQASSKQKEEELKHQWELRQNSVSSHSSGDEVFCCGCLLNSVCTIYMNINVCDEHLLQGEGSVVIRLAPPPEMLPNPQSHATPMKFNDSTEGEGDPKTGNTCNALSGKVQQNVNPSHPHDQAPPTQ